MEYSAKEKYPRFKNQKQQYKHKTRKWSIKQWQTYVIIYKFIIKYKCSSSHKNKDDKLSKKG